jgi:peptide/nickel transport system substrate-binding protein
MRRTLTIAVALVVILGLLLAACAGPTGMKPPKVPSEPQYGGTAVMCKISGPRTMLPQEMTMGAFMDCTPCYEGLFRWDMEFNEIPWLATDWKWDSDYKGLTFDLRQGVKFHDGTDFNAEAVKWNLDERAAKKYGEYTKLESIDVLGDYKVKLNLSEYQNLFTTFLATNASGWMYSPTAFKDKGADWANTHAVGTGPFKLDKYDVDQRVLWSKNENYWESGKPYLDGVEVRVYSDMTVMNMAFKGGEGQVITQTKDVDYLADCAKDPNIFMGGMYTLVFLVPESKNPDSPWANKKVREAAEYAMDSDTLAQGIGMGMWDATKQMVVTENKDLYDPKLDRKYNVEKARQLMAEAGYADGFSTKITSSPGSPKDALAVMMDNLKAIGIDSTLEVGTIGSWSGAKREGWDGLIVDSYPTLDYSAVNVIRWASGKFGTETVQLKNMKRPGGAWQQLLDDANAAPTIKEQNAKAKEIIKIINEDCTVIVPYAYFHGYLSRYDIYTDDDPGADWFWNVTPRGKNPGTSADWWLTNR